MEAMGLTRMTGLLLGRERECGAIDRMLEAARVGESATLVVRGEAGIGKTTLLDYASDRADGLVVLRATGIEAESNLAFSGLYGLLRPVLGKLDALPQPQWVALAGALGLAPSAAADRLLVSAAVLGVLAAAAEERPVLCLIDDAQWLDQPSADALVFAARRLTADPVAMLFGVREGEIRSFDAPGLPELILGGLDPAAAERLLSVSAREAAPTVHARLLLEARGNPLALLELPAGLSDAELLGAEALPESIPLTPRLRRLYTQRIERLPDAARTALLICAADDTGDARTILGATAAVDLPRDALDPAEAAGLIGISRGRVTFRHPLVRSAVYEGATLSQRQRAHSALASALSGEEHADRRVWHQATATLTGDEEVAAALEASARRSRARSAHASAATAFARAAELSTDSGSRARRLVAAARAAWDAGQADRAREAIAAALPTAGGQLRAELLHLKGDVEVHAGSVSDAAAILVDAAAAAEDASLKLEIMQEASEVAAYAGDQETARRMAAQQADIPPNTERDRFLVAVAAGWVAAFAGDNQAASAAFSDALARVASLDDPQALRLAGDAASAQFGLGSGLRYANQAVELARKRGLVSLLPLLLHRQALELIWNSRFDVAYAAAQEGYRLALDARYGRGGHLSNMATVEAIWGRSEEARAHADEALAIGRQSGSSLLADTAQMTLAFIELSAGKADEAVVRLLSLTNLERPSAHVVVALYAIPDLVEAAARVGREHEVEEQLERYRAWATATGTGMASALLARCDALVGKRSPDEVFGEELGQTGVLPPFQRARSELLYGEWLRRERRRQEARIHLRAAFELFHGVGAAPWEQRAEAELRATGERTRKRDPSTLDTLTPQELQIAGLVANGLSNKEIATQLYLSPRTIDYHLRKVFSKLGIASRTQLVREGLPDRMS